MLHSPVVAALWGVSISMPKEDKTLLKYRLSEREVIDHLRLYLPEAIERGIDLFTNSKFNPYKLPIREEAKYLYTFASSASKACEELGLDPNECISNLYIRCCEEAADLKNEHRRGPKKLAKWLQEQVQKRQTP